jgi:hypothetical protein
MKSPLTSTPESAEAGPISTMQPIQSRWRPTTVVLLTLAVVLVCHFLVENCVRLRQTGIVIGDDMESGLAAAGWKCCGFSVFFRYVDHLAKTEGRVFFYLTAFFQVLPFLFSDVLRALLTTAMELLTFVAISAYVSRLLNARVFTLLLVLVCAFLPYWANHYPTSSWIIYFHFPLFLCFVALLVFDYAERNTRAQWRKRLTLVSALILFVAVCFYEVLAVLMVFLLASLFVRQFLITPPSRRGDLYIRYAPFLGALALYAAIYLLGKKLLPGGYSGSQMTLATLTNFRRMFYVTAFYGVKGLPAGNFVFQKLYLAHAGNGSPYTIGLLRFAWENLRSSHYLWGAIVAAFSAVYLLIPTSETRTDPAVRRGALWVLALASVAAVIVNIPVSMSLRHQATPAMIYAYSYITFLGFIVALAACLVWLRAEIGSWNRQLGWLAVTVVSATLGTTSAVTQLANDSIIDWQANYNVRWKLADSWAQSRHFQSLPDDLTIISKALFEGDVQTEPNYWPQYIRFHSGRSVCVVNNIRQYNRGPAVVLEYRESAIGTKAFLLVTDLETITPGSHTPLSGTNLFILANHDPKQVILNYLSAKSECVVKREVSPSCSAVALPVRRLIEFQREGSFYVARVITDGMIVGTATIERRELGQPLAPILEGDKQVTQLLFHQ